jgi:hypothetical protein
MAIGIILDAKAKKEGRIRSPKEAKDATSVNFKLIVIIISLWIPAGLAALLIF